MDFQTIILPLQALSPLLRSTGYKLDDMPPEIKCTIAELPTFKQLVKEKCPSYTQVCNTTPCPLLTVWLMAHQGHFATQCLLPRAPECFETRCDGQWVSRCTSSLCPQKRCLLKAMKEVQAQYEEFEKKMAEMKPLTDEEQELYDSQVDMADKLKFLTKEVEGEQGHGEERKAVSCGKYSRDYFPYEWDAIHLGYFDGKPPHKWKLEGIIVPLGNARRAVHG